MSEYIKCRVGECKLLFKRWNTCPTDDSKPWTAWLRRQMWASMRVTHFYCTCLGFV